jgi:hypothetical protein
VPCRKQKTRQPEAAGFGLIYLRASAQAYELISAPRATSTIFGAFQLIMVVPFMLQDRAMQCGESIPHNPNPVN